jgi:P27 family predicted phage terminase small subunit
MAKPRPTVLLKLRGTFHVTRHGRVRAGEPEAPGDILSIPPAWMTDDQKAAWRHAVKHAPLGVLRRIDHAMLVAFIIAEDRHRNAAIQQAKLDAGAPLPLLTKGKSGVAMASPYLRIMNQAADVMIRTASEMGFTPASRPRLAPGAGARPNLPANDSPWTRLKVLQGGKTSA